MNVRWLTKAVFLTLVFAVYSANILPQQRPAQASESRAQLRFGQSIALSDFDCDGLIDEARLHESSLHRSIRVLLSRTGKLLSLRFDAKRADHGSLFAQDVDSDGATDLVWTDLLNKDDIVVWLGDGTGQFARAPSGIYCTGLTLGGSTVASPDRSTRETAIDSETDPPLDQAHVNKCIDRLAIGLPNQPPDFVADLSSVLGQPLERGPPLTVS